MHRLLLGVVALTATGAMTGAQASSKLLVAHRGASAYAPEHTVAAYRLALEQGADYVEQDLGLTKDGVLVCLHDPTLERTTDVEEVFPDRYRVVDGAKRWFVGDFTLEEVRRLDAGSWFDARFAGERIPTFEEAVALVRGQAGLFPELKSPELYEGRNRDMVEAFVESIRKTGLERDAATPLIVQSFDADALRGVAEGLPEIRRCLLLASRDGARWITADGLEAVKAFASAIGPAKTLIDVDPSLVRRAHAAGLSVIPYTFRSQEPARFDSLVAEMREYLYEYGVDGLFTDNPDLFPRK